MILFIRLIFKIFLLVLKKKKYTYIEKFEV